MSFDSTEKIIARNMNFARTFSMAPHETTSVDRPQKEMFIEINVFEKCLLSWKWHFSKVLIHRWASKSFNSNFLGGFSKNVYKIINRSNIVYIKLVLK